MVIAKNRMLAIVAIAMAVMVAAGVALALPAQAQAAGKKVWVLSSTSCNDGYNLTKYAYSYNKNGLLTKQKATDKWAEGKTTSGYYYKYDKAGNYTACTYSDSTGNKLRYKFTFDKQKRVASFVVKGNSAYGNEVWKAKYNAKGKLVKHGGWKVTYDSKGNETKYKGKSVAYIYTRDAKGNITKIVTTDRGKKYTAGALKYTYVKGLISQSTPVYDGYEGTPTKYKFKQITVPAKFAAKVKAQQRLILDCIARSGGYDYELFLVNK